MPEKENNKIEIRSDEVQDILGMDQNRILIL